MQVKVIEAKIVISDISKGNHFALAVRCPVMENDIKSELELAKTLLPFGPEDALKMLTLYKKVVTKLNELNKILEDESRN